MLRVRVSAEQLPAAEGLAAHTVAAVVSAAFLVRRSHVLQQLGAPTERACALDAAKEARQRWQRRWRWRGRGRRRRIGDDRAVAMQHAHVPPQVAGLLEPTVAVRALVVALSLVQSAHVPPQVAGILEPTVAERTLVLALSLVHASHMPVEVAHVGEAATTLLAFVIAPLLVHGAHVPCQPVLDRETTGALQAHVSGLRRGTRALRRRGNR